ncbi:MAG: type II toxin-antitoxin system RelE/ParE family toxin [Terriglobia bacterium]|jgi:plasmid stabilization system protein ParE
MRRLTILPQAELDVSDATAWYEKRRTGLSDEFLDELDTVLRRVIKSPFQFPKIKNNVRRALLRRFPCAVYFGVTRETVELIAVLYQHRDPRTWEKRIIAE